LDTATVSPTLIPAWEPKVEHGPRLVINDLLTWLWRPNARAVARFSRVSEQVGQENNVWAKWCRGGYDTAGLQVTGADSSTACHQPPTLRNDAAVPAPKCFCRAPLAGCEGLFRHVQSFTDVPDVPCKCGRPSTFWEMDFVLPCSPLDLGGARRFWVASWSQPSSQHFPPQTHVTGSGPYFSSLPH